jgi:hypothetical protein
MCHEHETIANTNNFFLCEKRMAQEVRHVDSYHLDQARIRPGPEHYLSSQDQARWPGPLQTSSRKVL